MGWIWISTDHGITICVKKERKKFSMKHTFMRPKTSRKSNELTMLKHSWLVGAFSPVIHKGLHQGWTHTSFCLQVIHFTSHHITSHVLWAYLYSAGTQHGNLPPAGWPTLFCGPTQEPCISHSQHRKNQEKFWKKCRWMDWKGRNKQGRNPWQ